ncbi:MAG: energy-coupled thiamine transporter ThiT [Clostridia bacterium]|nr:energy-coupled thiamine transporter ThiT [Clostridia bacterium]
MKANTRVLVECSILVAISVVLSVLKLWQMPLGGSITLVSMLPVCVISLRHGLKWGFLSSFVYSLFQLFLGITTEGLLGWGLKPVMLAGCIFFDYLLAFSVLGIAGIFRNRGEKGIYTGLSLAFFLRFVSHFISGYVIFRNLDTWDIFGKSISDSPVLYSICYNGFYLLPELVITLVVVAVLMRFPTVKEKILVPCK